MLKSFGHRTRAFSDPKAYLDYIASEDFERPSAVFTDVSMPVMNGYAMMRAVKARLPDMRFVIMTGEPGLYEENKEDACMYLHKPFRPDSLQQVIDKLALCTSTTPSNHHGCCHADERHGFQLQAWVCPHCKCQEGDAVA